jgi:plastocyanin
MKRPLATISLLMFLATCGCDRSSQASASPAALPRVLPGNGVIRGNVKFIGTPPLMKTFTSTEACCQSDSPLADETVLVNSNGTLRNVLVYLENAPATDGSHQPPALLDQVHCHYVPHVIGVQVGQTLTIRSSDPTMHNVHFICDKNPVRNLAMVQAGQEIPVKFDYAEIVKMKCDVHPWMTAWVGVFDNPFFAVTQDDGSFQIKNIPAGTYKLVALHELYGRAEQTITVADDKPADVQFVFGKQG